MAEEKRRFSCSPLTVSLKYLTNKLKIVKFSAATSNNREFWKEYIHRRSCTFSMTLRKRASTTIRSDRELMLEACTRNYFCLRAVDASLQVDKNFLDLLLQKEPRALVHLSQKAQRLFPQLVPDHLSAYFPHGDHESLFLKIVPEFWDNRQNILFWFQNGGLFVQYMPDAWRNDRQIFLLLAEHNNIRTDTLFRFAASIELRSDKEFAMQVLEYKPNIFFCFHDSVTRDLDVALLGCTGFSDFRASCEKRERYTYMYSVPRNLTADLVERVNTLLSARKAFETLLLGIAGDSSGLAMLNLGLETSVGFKRLIADFVGDMPMGPKLRHVRKAARHLGLQ